MILQNLIYIYQLENYSKKRFLSFVYSKINWFSFSKRKKLIWTTRSTLVFLLSILFFILFITTSHYFAGLLGSIASIFLGIIFLPLIIIFVDIFISPLILFQKNKVVRKAKKIIQDSKNKKFIPIGITGSFGKTSMKNILVSILSEKYKIFTFPGNINTDIGVAQYLIKHQQEVKKADILVSEMGAYQKGEIKKLCDIVNPYYSITTSIGECHLERFGSFENIVSAKFELANATEKEAFLNYCDENIKKYADDKITDNSKLRKVCGSKEVQNIKHLENFEGISFEYNGETFTTKVVADYIIDFSIIAFKIAEELKLSILEMKNGLRKVRSVPHRLEIIKNKELNRTIIDDSYNGNYTGFLLGLNILNRAKGRKVVLTPGIVELSKKKTQEVHENLAKKYIENVDLVLLIKNKNTDFIIDKFKEKRYNIFKVYKTAKKAHDDLVHVLKNGDTIIFQNDVSDNYS